MPSAVALSSYSCFLASSQHIREWVCSQPWGAQLGTVCWSLWPGLWLHGNAGRTSCPLSQTLHLAQDWPTTVLAALCPNWPLFVSFSCIFTQRAERMGKDVDRIDLWEVLLKFQKRRVCGAWDSKADFLEKEEEEMWKNHSKMEKMYEQIHTGPAQLEHKIYKGNNGRN